MGAHRTAVSAIRLTAERWVPARRTGHHHADTAWMLAAACAVITACASRGAATELISVGTDGRAAGGPSTSVSVNADGNFVAFASDAPNIVPNDTNQVRDVFVHSRDQETSERVSVSSTGTQGNGASDAPSIDGNGTVVAFQSDASNLVDGDTNGKTDVFVRVRSGAGLTERVSVTNDGKQANGASADPSISSDGRFVAFQSAASNLVANDTNGFTDIFVRDRVNGTTERVCDGVQPNGDSLTPSISADGNFVAFSSAATNLVPGDTNGKLDIFVCDRRSGSIDRASVSTAGVQGNDDSVLPAINSVGCVVAFKSLASNLVPNDHNGVVDVFARDRSAGITERISVDPNGNDANDASFPPSIDYDGRFVAFGSAATNLVFNDENHVPSVFVRDRQKGQTQLVDLNNSGQQADSGTPDVPPSISGDATAIGFVSTASNLAINDQNEALDVFVNSNPFISAPEESTTCCQCDGAAPSCAPPILGACPPACTPICEAACEGTTCVTFTPTPVVPTPTNTPSRADCCQCTGQVPACQPPNMGQCSTGCSVVFNAACQSAGCATVTPTQSPSPTPGAQDCCQCNNGVPFCARPVDGTCPSQCDIVRSALCLGANTPGTGNCVTLTPTATRSPATATPTRTSTPVGSATNTRPTSTATATASATGPTATATATRPTATATATGPTATATGPTATATATGPTATATATGGTATPTRTGSATATATGGGGGTPTHTASATANTTTGTATSTATQTAVATTTSSATAPPGASTTPTPTGAATRTHTPPTAPPVMCSVINPCPPGETCDPVTGHCVAATPTKHPDDDAITHGCAVTPGGSQSNGALWLGLPAIAGLLMRRRSTR